MLKMFQPPINVIAPSSIVTDSVKVSLSAIDRHVGSTQDGKAEMCTVYTSFVAPSPLPAMMWAVLSYFFVRREEFIHLICKYLTFASTRRRVAHRAYDTKNVCVQCKIMSIRHVRCHPKRV